jgi:hypothetical protein
VKILQAVHFCFFVILFFLCRVDEDQQAKRRGGRGKESEVVLPVDDDWVVALDSFTAAWG